MCSVGFDVVLWSKSAVKAKLSAKRVWRRPWLSHEHESWISCRSRHGAQLDEWFGIFQLRDGDQPSQDIDAWRWRRLSCWTIGLCGFHGFFRDWGPLSWVIEVDVPISLSSRFMHCIQWGFSCRSMEQSPLGPVVWKVLWRCLAVDLVHNIVYIGR